MHTPGMAGGEQTADQRTTPTETAPPPGATRLNRRTFVRTSLALGGAVAAGPAVAGHPYKESHPHPVAKMPQRGSQG
jgi:hypothetical protein